MYKLSIVTMSVVFLIASCSRAPAMLTFVSDLHTPNICGNYPGNEAYSVDSFAFFVSNLSMKIDGQWQPVEFLPGSLQTTNSALINLTPKCKKGEQTRIDLPLALSHHKFSNAESIKFTLGVEFEQNHRNPVSLPSPLNDSTMFWSWQRGHKFVRLDMSSEKGSGWHFHLGSVGCESSSALRAPENACTSPNLFAFELNIDGTEGVILVPAQQWLDGIDVSRDQSCMFSAPIEQTCSSLVSNVQQKGFRWVSIR